MQQYIGLSRDGTEQFIYPPWLPQEHVCNCRVFADRTVMIAEMPKGGTVAEVGTETGAFAKIIMERTAPANLHIFDVSFEQFDHAYFAPTTGGVVSLHEGDSSTEMARLPAGSFDWIYIDGDHAYEGVQKDIREAMRLIKHGGSIVFNDYTPYSPLDRMQFGVMRAVNEMCLQFGFEIYMLGFNSLGYHDVATRRIG